MPTVTFPCKAFYDFGNRTSRTAQQLEAEIAGHELMHFVVPHKNGNFYSKKYGDPLWGLKKRNMICHVLKHLFYSLEQIYYGIR